MAKKQTEELLESEQPLQEETPKKAKAAKTDKAKTGWEKWLCAVKNGEAEKLKRIKAGIQISDEEAEVLNAGRLTGGNVGNVEMFFKPE